MDTLKKVMDRSFKDLKVDKELVKKTSAFYNSLMMRDEIGRASCRERV